MDVIPLSMWDCGLNKLVSAQLIALSLFAVTYMLLG